MPDLDLDALAAEVAAVLDRHGPSGTFCTVARSPLDRAPTKLWCGGERWDLSLRPGESQPFFSGRITPAAFDVLSTVWVRVHGQSGEGDPLAMLKAAEQAFAACVVPKAEHDALMAELAALRRHRSGTKTVLSKRGLDGALAAFDAYRAALGEHP